MVGVPTLFLLIFLVFDMIDCFPFFTGQRISFSPLKLFDSGDGYIT